jgi:hypothetical protein
MKAESEREIELARLVETALDLADSLGLSDVAIKLDSARAKLNKEQPFNAPASIH